MAVDELNGFTLKAYHDDRLTLVELGGMLKLQNSEAVKRRVLGLLESGLDALYLHTGQLADIDSSGLGVLVGLHMTARKNKVALQLLAPTLMQKKLFDATRLNMVLSMVHEPEAEAIRQRLARPEHAIPIPF